MTVLTESARVVTARRTVLELLLSSGKHNCAAAASSGEDWTAFQCRVQDNDGDDSLCPAWGDCRLQDLAYRYQVTGTRFAPPGFVSPRPNGSIL